VGSRQASNILPKQNTKLSTYQLLDVAVHGVVYNRDLGSHLERIEGGYQTTVTKNK
jgi:hypothetical protein